MFGMNTRGYDTLSSSLQAGQVDFLQLANDLNLDAYASLAVAASEMIRVALKGSAVPNPNMSFYADPLFALAQTSNSSVFVGLSDGRFIVYGPQGPVFGTGFSTGNATVTIFVCDELGAAKDTIAVVPGFSPLQRPWYQRGASEWGRVRMVDVYSYSAANQVGTSFAIAIAANLSAPSSLVNVLSPVAPLVNRSGTDGIFAVVGVDVELQMLTSFLSRIRGAIQPDSVTSWIFDNRGFLVAASDPTVQLSTPEGGLVFALSANHTVIQEAMWALLGGAMAASKPPPWMIEYSAIANAVSREATVLGEPFLLSHAAFHPAGEDAVEWHVVIAQPRSLYYQPIMDANLVALLLIFLVMLPVVMILSGCLAHRLLSKPTREIAKRMDNLTKDFEFGEGEQRQQYSHIAEVRTIQRSFDAMRNAIKSFSKFAPVHVVKSLLYNHNEATLGVEDTECTIFFSDLVGFTQISETVRPEVLITTLAEYFEAMSGIIEKHGGLFLDFQGDSVFAQFAGQEHEARAVDAAVEQQEALHALRRGWRARGQPELFARMGLNSGSVLAGNIGSAGHMKHTCIGDNVNLAARLEGLARLYGVSMVLAQSTYNTVRVRERFVGQCLDYISVYGKMRPTLVVTVIGRRSEASERELMVEQLSFRAMEEFRSGRFAECLAMRRQLREWAGAEEETEQSRAMTERVRAMAESNGGAVPKGWTGATVLNEK